MQQVRFLLALAAIVCFSSLKAQDTTIVQTLTFDSTSRSGTWMFPPDTGQTYRKILMQYKMRCHNAAVGNGNVGCREWDYSCNTIIRDSSQQDSAAATHPTVGHQPAGRGWGTTTARTHSQLTAIGIAMSSTRTNQPRTGRADHSPPLAVRTAAGCIVPTR